MKKQLFSLLSFLMLCIGIQAQTILISPTGDGGFETGSTFSANGWTVVNGATNTWNVGTATFNSGTNSAYISNTSGSTYAYSNTTADISHFYKDVTFPAGQTIITLTFKLKGDGDIFSGTYYDKLMVFTAPTSFTPTNTLPASPTNTLAGATLVYSQPGNYGTGYVTVTVSLPASLAGTTTRLIFTWHDDTSAGTVPSSVDDISLTSRAPGNFISIATGNWTSPATWDANAVPTAADNVTVTATHTVTIDAASQAAKDLTIDGSLTYSSTPTSFSVANNILVNATGSLLAFNGTTGKTLNINGNFTNDGTVDFSKTGSVLNINGSAAQSISGSGSVASGIIAGLTFNNSATSPLINWSWPNINVSGSLTFTKGWVNLGAANKLTLGTAIGTTGTLNYTAGGFLNGTFSRWWSNAGTGSNTTAGSDPTNGTSRYPFINASGLNRAAYIQRVTPTAGGQYSCRYVDASSMSPVAVSDGTYAVQSRYDGNWTFSTEGTSPAAASYNLVLLAQSSYSTTNGNSRIIGASAILGGTHRNGTTTPGAQRTGLLLAELTSGPAYIGANSSDIVLPCTGAPNAGTAVSTSTAICSATNFTLSLTGASTGVTGLGYQWQSSPDNLIWTSIPSATLSTAVVSQTAATYYQCIVSCIPSTMSATSTPVQVVQNNFLNCYCVTSPSTGGVNDIVTNVTAINSLGQNLTQASTYTAPAYFVSYNNTPLDLVQGSTSNTVSITMGSDGTQHSAAWIDFNQNGIYEASENIGVSSSAATSGATVSYTFTVPMGASLGNTRMRVRGGSDSPGYTAAGACSATSYGETEDYLVNIIVPPTCFAPTGLTASNITSSSVDISWTAPTSGTPTGYVGEIRTSGAAGSGSVGLVGSGTIPVPTTSVSIPGLAGLTSYTVYVRSDCGAGDLSSWTSTTFTTLASCPVPTSLTISAITPTSAIATWTAGATETEWDIYYGPVPLAAPTASTAATGTTSTTNYTLNPITPAMGYDVYVRANCGAGNKSIWTPVTSFMTPCLPPNITGTMPGSRCGIGTVTLGVTADPGAVVNWYTAATGGTAIATGSVLTTPVISTTTPYYAEAGNVSMVVEKAGIPSITASSSTNTNYGDHGIVFSTTKNNVTVVSAKLYVVGSGSVTIALRDGTDTEISSTSAISVTGSGSVTPITVPINLTTNVSGEYYLIVKSATGITSMYVEDSPSYPYVSASGNVSVTAGYWYGFDDATHRYFYDVEFQYSGLCVSTRTMVTATVTPAPALTLNSPSAICSGSGIATLSVTSTASNYDSYTWSPTTGLYTDAGATTAYTGGNASVVYASSNAPGTLNYNVNANNSISGCASTTTTSIMINNTPMTAVTPSASISCLGAPVTFTASTSGGSMINIFSDNFNAAPIMTAVNNGGIASTIFTQRNDGYITTGTSTYTWHPTTNTSFMLSNSDGGGSGGVTNTELVSPVINTTNYTALNLKFNHHIKHYGTSVGTIEVSTDGGANWTIVQTYSSNVGASTAFAAESINLNSYINQANFKFKFKFAAGWSWFWGIDDVALEAPTNPDFSWIGSSVNAGLPAAAGTPAPGNNTVTVSPTGTGIYTYTVTAQEGACSSNAVATLTVNVIPTVTAIASQTLLCDNGSTGSSILTASTTATSYLWSDGATTMTTAVTPTLTTTYTVTVTEAGCSADAFVTITVSNCNGVKELVANGINIYPNPAHDVLNISVSAELAGATSIEVYDAIGKLVIKETLGTSVTSINTSKLEDGMYVFKVINNNKAVKIGKIVKQ